MIKLQKLTTDFPLFTSLEMVLVLTASELMFFSVTQETP